MILHVFFKAPASIPRDIFGRGFQKLWKCVSKSGKNCKSSSKSSKILARGFQKMADKQQDLWLNLGIGAHVYHGERACRIKTTSSLDTVLLEDLQTRECFSAKIKDLLQDPGDGVTTQAREHVNILEIAQEDWDRAKERQVVLDELLQKDIYESQDIVDCAQQLGLTSRHIYNLVRRYQESGLQLAALLPTKPSGGAGKLRLSANIEDIITAVIKEVY